MPTDIAIVTIAYSNFNSIFKWELDSNTHAVYATGVTATLLDDGPPAVTAVRDEAGNASLRVTGPATIRFRLITPGVYPVGLAFKKAHGDASESSTPASMTAMPRDRITFGHDGVGHYVQFFDADTDSLHWDYYIMVQDNWGNFAVIDPEVENEAA
jgi:plastocyanin